MKTILTHNGYSVTINHKGAELSSYKNPQDKEFIWQANPEFWAKHSPVLFPIVGSLKNDRYSYKNKEYQMSRHGFARDNEFTLTHHSENQAVFLYKFDAQTLKSYPFEFVLQINYKLVENKLSIGYSVGNEGTSKMPFALGAHPAFSFDGPIEQYSLDFGEQQNLKVSTLEKGLLSDKITIRELNRGSLNLDYSIFSNDALILKNVPAKQLTLKKQGKAVVKLDYEGFPHLGLWTMNNAPFICIEPWYGYSDSVSANGNLLEKESMLLLEPQAVFNTNFTIEVF